jgi:hypothetical protein
LEEEEEKEKKEKIDRRSKYLIESPCIHLKTKKYSDAEVNGCTVPNERFCVFSMGISPEDVFPQHELPRTDVKLYDMR